MQSPETGPATAGRAEGAHSYRRSRGDCLGARGEGRAGAGEVHGVMESMGVGNVWSLSEVVAPLVFALK